MKTVSALKGVFTKSANNLHETAFALAVNADQDFDTVEKVVKNITTIENQLKAMATLSDAELEYARGLDYKFGEIKSLTKAESREFYKRLRNILAAATGGSYRDVPLSSFIMNFGVNGPSESYSYGELQSMFGHATTTQAGYFARCMRLLGAGNIDNSHKGNGQRNYRFVPNWSAKLWTDLTGLNAG